MTNVYFLTIILHQQHVAWWHRLDRHLSIDTRGIWMCALSRIITTSLDASDVIPQPPPSTALSHHASSCHPAVQPDVIPHHNPRQAPHSAIMPAAVTLQCSQMSYHTTTPAKHHAQPSCQRLSPRSAARCHTTPQPPPSTTLSRHVSGCHPAVHADDIPHHNPRQAPRSAIMPAAVTLQCSQMSYHTTTPAKHHAQPSCQRL